LDGLCCSNIGEVNHPPVYAQSEKALVSRMSITNRIFRRSRDPGVYQSRSLCIQLRICIYAFP
jgi:hypothetical protein